MIHRVASIWTSLGRPRVSALLLVVSLNLALVPCTMALEVVEQGHDCCPPELQLESSECCELDDVSVDARSDWLKLADSPDLDAHSGQSCAQLLNPVPVRYTAAVDPPDPPGDSRPLYDLYCVYLK